jgi:STE24 endopeptidase
MTTLDPERQQQAKQYARIRRRLWLVDTAFSALYTLAWLFFGWSDSLRDWLTTLITERWPLFTGSDWLLVPAFVLVFGGIYLILNLPLGYYNGFVLPHRFNQSTQSFKDWVIDQFKGLVVGAPIGLILVDRGWTVDLQCAAFQPCAGVDHAALQ